MNALKTAEGYFKALAETLCERGEALEVNPSGVAILGQDGKEVAVYTYKQVAGDATSHYAVMVPTHGKDFSVNP